jgi:HK97 gp10 family phage protein
MKLEAHGAQDVIKKLEALGGKVERKVLGKSIRTGLKVLLAECKANAPVDGGLLRKSLAVLTALKKKRGTVVLEVRPNEKKFLGGHYYPAQVEYGRKKKNQPPNPFMLKAFSHRGEAAKDAAVAAVAKGIDDLVKGS